MPQTHGRQVSNNSKISSVKCSNMQDRTGQWRSGCERTFAQFSVVSLVENSRFLKQIKWEDISGEIDRWKGSMGDAKWWVRWWREIWGGMLLYRNDEESVTVTNWNLIVGNSAEQIVKQSRAIQSKAMLVSTDMMTLTENTTQDMMQQDRLEQDFYLLMRSTLSLSLIPNACLRASLT